jgi:hypothetical protein
MGWKRFPNIPTKRRMTMEQQEPWQVPYIDPQFNPLQPLDESGQGQRYEGDKHLYVSFYVRPVLHPMRSQEAQRAIYVEEDYIRIVTPGSRLTVIDAPVTSGNYMRRFGKQYNAWKVDAKAHQDGTPLEAFPVLFSRVGMIAELQAINIRTVEQLAAIADNNIGNIMGGHELRAKAKAYIDSIKGTDVQLLALNDENAKMRIQLELLQKQLAVLQTAHAAKK